MEPHIQYAGTSDGVSIAYASVGSGPPLLRAAAPGSHVRLDWASVSAMRLLSQSFHGVWYDSRGGGLSERRAADFSIDAMLRDLEAVVEAVGFDRFALVAAGDAVPIGVTYAGQNQARISQLILIDAWVKASDYQQGFPYEIERAMRAKSPEAYLEAASHLLFPDSPEAARRFVAESPKRIDTDVYVASQTAMEEWNAEAFLAEIRAPTLVVSNRNSVWLPPEVAQRIAAGIADCRLVFEDTGTDRVASLIEGFVLGSPAQPVQAKDLPSGTAVILFADIADSTALTERLGDAAFREKARDLDAALRQAITERKGTPIEGKLLGDGVLATFSSAKDAIESAIECAGRGRHMGLPLHVGVHAGDVIREERNVYGGAVNIAARISDAAAPGEVLVSDVVRGLARTSAGVAFEDRGERALKGIEEAIRVWRVIADEESGNRKQEAE